MTERHSAGGGGRGVATGATTLDGAPRIGNAQGHQGGGNDGSWFHGVNFGLDGLNCLPS